MSTDPYLPPDDDRGARISAWALVAASVAAGVGGPLTGFALLTTPTGDGPALILLFGGPLAAIVLGVAALIPAFLERRSKLALAGGLAGLASAGLFGFVGTGVFFLFARGRQLRRNGRLELPLVREGVGWAATTEPIVLPAEVRTGVALAWRENGRTEHASVAAFARLSLELIAVGAPPELLVDAAHDAVDEIRHTEATFALARAIDGQALSPAPFPSASTAGVLAGHHDARLAELAVTSLVDGVLHEGVSGRVIGALAGRCEVPPITRVLQQLSADEERHAAHAWDVVVFCLREGGEPVRRALIAAAAAIEPEIRSPHPEAASGGAWERYGIAGRALEQETYRVVLGELHERIRPLLQAEAA